ncbi:hypothetical protein KC614_00820 [candidate division WWE3 bacterium]|uniref:Uncharacterized protein n=1 Tax=candidate division WWE3 bacterium TaxID=2053526 RepID=A0A955LK32_UNCKA|nr:hypothetical protein [candidate division WWE3 bacterium]
MFKNRIVLINTVVSLVIAQIIFWVVFLNADKLPPQVPLWFINNTPIAQLADKVYIWLLPGAAIGVVAINLFFALTTYKWQPFLIGIIMALCGIANAVLLLDTLRILGNVIGWF